MNELHQKNAKALNSSQVGVAVLSSIQLLIVIGFISTRTELENVAFDYIVGIVASLSFVLLLAHFYKRQGSKETSAAPKKWSKAAYVTLLFSSIALLAAIVYPVGRLFLPMIAGLFEYPESLGFILFAAMLLIPFVFVPLLTLIREGQLLRDLLGKRPISQVYTPVARLSLAALTGATIYTAHKLIARSNTIDCGDACVDTVYRLIAAVQTEGFVIFCICLAAGAAGFYAHRTFFK